MCSIKRCVIFSPDMRRWFEGIADPRHPAFIVYPLSHVLWVGILTFLLKLGARRQIKYLLHTSAVQSHLNVLAKADNDTVCHGDTLEKLLRRIPSAWLSEVRTAMVLRLIRMKALVNSRLLDRYYLIAVDATGVVTFSRRHCPHCLTMTSKKTGKTTYYHPVLEAKIITAHGMAFSIETEFIENPQMERIEDGRLRLKQDCELKAFARLTEKLKKWFPQLNICLTLDGLYAAGSVFKRCEEYGWKCIVVFKRGSMSATYGEFEALKKLQAHHRTSCHSNGVSQRFSWANTIPYQGMTLHGIECQEQYPLGTNKTFVWITNIEPNARTVIPTANYGGRSRWTIENQGFNTQKNGGYNLEHAYSKNPNASKNYYLLLQIAHTLNQLIEKGNLITASIYGSIKNLTFHLRESLRTMPITPADYEQLFAAPFQIRLNSS
jgi:hypothetical protein